MKKTKKVVGMVLMTLTLIIVPSVQSHAMLERDFQDTIYWLEQDYATMAPLTYEEALKGCYTVEQLNYLLQVRGYLTEYREEFVSKGLATAVAATQTEQANTPSTEQANAPSYQEVITAEVLQDSAKLLYEVPSTMYAKTQFNMRKEPNVNADRTRVVLTAEEVKIIGEYGDDYYICLIDSEQCYCKKNYLQETEPATIEIEYQDADGNTKTQVVPKIDDTAMGHDYTSLDFENNREMAENAINALSFFASDGIENNCFINITPNKEEAKFNFENYVIPWKVLYDCFSNEEEESVTICIYADEDTILASYSFEIDNFKIPENEEAFHLGFRYETTDEKSKMHFYENEKLNYSPYIMINPFNQNFNHLYAIDDDTEELEYLGGCKPYESAPDLYGLGRIQDFSRDYVLSTRLIETATVSENQIKEAIPIQKNYTGIIIISSGVVIGIGVIALILKKRKRK